VYAPRARTTVRHPERGARHIAVAGKLRAEGVKRGVPDLCLPVPQGAFHGLFVELKTETGRATPEQRQWIETLRRLGYRAEICHGWDAAREVISSYLGMTSAPAPRNPAHVVAATIVDEYDLSAEREL
jgi:hypothetical protein